MATKEVAPVEAGDFAPPPKAMNSDEQRLAELGYKQELRRGLTTLTNFGMSFSIVSFLTSITGSWGIAWYWGGPVSALWGWIIASAMTLIVAIAMAEICSAYPTSGGLYYWAARLGGNQRVFASWITGWFNLLGQVAITAGVGMACCNSIVALAVMNGSPARANRHGGYSMASYVGGAPNAIGAPGPLAIPEPCPYDGTGALVTAAYQSSWMAANNGSLPMDILGNSFTAGEIAFNVNECNRKPINPTQGQIYAIYIGVMVLAGLLNSFSVRALNGIVTFSILWHILGSIIIIIALPSISRAKWNTKFVWEFWQPNNNAFGTQQLCTKASSAGNPIIFGCPLYGVQTAPPGNTIFQANANGVYVANNAINWGGNGINAQALHMNGKSGNSVNAYIFFCGLLMSQWCYTGYDASAHMSEETKDASTAGPKGIISTIVVTFAFGLAYIVSFIVSIVDFNNTTGGPFALNYNPAAQIFWDVFETRYGNGRYCCGLWIIPLVAQFLCTVASVTSNSRMLYAFARDDAVPGSKLWHVINDRVQIPVNAVWGMCIAALLIALPVINNVEAFAAVTSIATIGLYISYGAPVFCRLTVGRKEFLPGPFFTGRMSVPIAIAAVCWVMTITIFFVLPNTFPIDMKLNFNYAIIAVGVVLVYSVATWVVPGPKPFNARKWFQGPNLKGLELDKVIDGGPGASVHGGPVPPVPLGV